MGTKDRCGEYKRGLTIFTGGLLWDLITFSFNYGNQWDELQSLCKQVNQWCWGKLPYHHDAALKIQLLHHLDDSAPAIF